MNSYHYTTTTPETLEAFRNRPCSLPFFDQNYRPPTPEEIHNLRKLMGLSQANLARVLGVSFNEKGSNTVRKWETAEGKENHRPIVYATWRLMLAVAGIIEPTKDMEKLKEIR
tara:strand:+ start:1800 stop:2138 length:339 start_codon:yes stop_codon:yes gene_type:complete